MYWLNLISILLGLIALALPSYFLIKKKVTHRYCHLAVFFSMAWTVFSVFLQAFYTRQLVQLTDWSALLDTQGVVVLISGVLILLILFVNGLVLFNYHRTVLVNDSLS
ncbi:hypothetical protein [Alkalibacterium sp. MB6]|uniref:hypothetical protein n=1 Tax=Alkalibacterium sp. MB6 TaxID=2081965 RepID=UPI0013794211|nr:hypothetical protein [Alkalibacterium sp. MB6]